MFNSCTGYDKVLGLTVGTEQDIITELEDVFGDISEKCGDIDEEDLLGMQSSDAGVPDECMNAILGDNPVGNLIREMYHHPDKFCACTQAFGDAVPQCLLTDPISDSTISGSLFKSSACLVGLTCSHIDDFCTRELEALDSCLPPMNDNTLSNEEVIKQCEADESMLIGIPAQLSKGQLPDACERVYNEKMSDSQVLERFNRQMNADASVPQPNCDNGGCGTGSSKAFLTIVIVFAGLAIIAVLAYMYVYKRKITSPANTGHEAAEVKSTLSIFDSI